MSDKKPIEPRRLKGFRDYAPTLMEKRTSLMQVIRAYAGKAGFREIGTPALEYAETLLGQGSDETDKQVYTFEDHGGRKVGLRFDLTVPFARYVGEHHGELTFPFKRLQIGDVWRGENTQKGRYREFCQCDLDIIGADTVVADVEILLAFGTLLSSFEVGPFTMKLGNRPVLSALVRKLLNVAGAEVPALIVLDKLDKIGPEKVKVQLGELAGPGANIDLLLQILTEKNKSGWTDADRVRPLLDGDDAAQFARLETIAELLKVALSTWTDARVCLDLSIARGLGYYTGVVFETTLDRLPGFGSVCSGGRYNDLASRFINRTLAGVGGSIGLDRLLAGMEELNLLPSASAIDVFIAMATRQQEQVVLAYAFKIATMLRERGLRCDLAVAGGKVGSQFKHADRLGAKYVVTIGDDEVANSQVSIKTMATGQEQRGVALGDLLALVSV